MQSKHLSLSTTTTETSTRQSSVSIADYHNPEPLDLEAQITDYQRLPATDAQTQPEMEERLRIGQSSLYSLSPEYIPQSPSEAPGAYLRADASEQHSASDSNPPTRYPSTRVANYHSSASYLDLVPADGQPLLTNEHADLPAVPPPIPRRSSRRGSEPIGIDGRLVGSGKGDGSVSVLLRD